MVGGTPRVAPTAVGYVKYHASKTGFTCYGSCYSVQGYMGRGKCGAYNSYGRLSSYRVMNTVFRRTPSTGRGLL